MYDHETRWFALAPVTLLLGCAVLTAETAGVWGRFPARPDWFWILAFFAALRTPPLSSIMTFAWCGLARDMLLGPRPGAASIAFVLVGWMALYWKPLASSRSWVGQAVGAGAGAFLVAVIKHGLDAGHLAWEVMEKIFFLSVGDGLLTSLAFLPMALVLSIPSFRPCRQRNGLFM